MPLLMTRAGTPTTTELEGTLFKTTAPAPITTLLPTVTGPRIFTPVPI